ncbi:penicillin acylase family protein [Robiginitalea sp. IMCC44478]|uniref:penicillin acylase family protein n=1 Tax=Robiginitalea sp. IMCC44478 TaxID=3459122 RepID=UPI004043331B
MKKVLLAIVFLLLFSCKEKSENEYKLPGLQEGVEVFRDPYGINHIYAENEYDLFYTQGYLAARDRLFQFEIWRRQATGTVSEILGERALKRDIGTRLFKYRGDLNTEFSQYHENGVAIINAYTEGVNAYIDEALQEPDSLPVEFRALGILPGKWTPEVVISRHQGLLGNIEDELAIGRAVAALGAEKVKSLLWFHPKEPDLSLQPGIDSDALSENILELYEAYRTPVTFEPADLLPEYRNSEVAEILPTKDNPAPDSLSIGSNNWVVSGALMANGKPFMANDPHRSIKVPSLRYMAHLVAPGWDVIGGGEPEIPGISIGHNPYGAWGLTVFRTDGEDLYVYETNPADPNQYKYKGEWVNMEIIQDSIPLKDGRKVGVQLKYTRHGPVVFEDSKRKKAYAVRCAWMEPGGSPYLASLRMDQAKNWDEFRAACNYSNIPGENMVWADVDGNIGWQAVGIAPVRRNFSGLVPVPGNGNFEWEGYLPIVEKPHLLNPEKGFIETANQNVTPESYSNWDAIGFTWADSFRGNRIEEVLSASKTHTMDEMAALQTDYLSLPARELLPFLFDLSLEGDALEARKYLETWDYILSPDSRAAAIYVAWENEIKKQAFRQFVPEEGQAYIQSLQLEKIIEWIRAPENFFGNEANRNTFLQETFRGAVDALSERLGPEMEKWNYGQENLKHILIRHPLSASLSPDKRKGLDLGPLPRGGNGYTPGSTGNGYRQSSGATFRVLIPVGDWDNALGINSPGQSGDPDSPYYGNLFEMWAQDRYFPLLYSKDSIAKYADSRYLLLPENHK